MSTPWYEDLNPIHWFEVATEDVATARDDAYSWLSGLGGDIASGIEGAFVAVLGDLWAVLVGPVYIAIGVFIAIITIGWFFRSGIGRIAGTLAVAGAMA